MNAGRMRLVLAAMFMCSLAGGCGNYDINEVNAFLLEPRAKVSGVEYEVMPPDVIKIGSMGMPEVNDVTTMIRPDGMINLPLVGELDVAGKTPAEIEGMILQASKPYYEKGDATVQVVGYNSKRFYVFGQVARQGPMAWNGANTLLDALAMAQPTTLAWPERITLIRGDSPQAGGVAATEPSRKYLASGVRPESPDRPRRKMMLNLNAMIKSGDMSNNVLLMPNDVINVPPNPLAAIGLALQQLLFPIRPAMEAAAVPTAVVY